MILLLAVAFLSGLITIFAPCIWPLLPIVLSSSATGGHKKPLGVTLGILVSFGFFTLAISYILKIIPFNPNILRYVAVIIIAFFGLVLVIPALNQYLEGLVSRLSGKLKTTSSQKNLSGQGFWQGIITGFFVGIVWSPCAGPILATVAALAATRTVNIQIIIVTIVYLTGIGIPLFIFASLGSRIFIKSKVLSPYTGRIQQIFGIIMLLTAVAIGTNYDKILEAKLLDMIPSYSNLLNSLEGNPAVTQQLNALKKQNTQTFHNTQVPLNSSSLPVLGIAPELTGITHWLNLPAGKQQLSLKELKGKVVLIDFWTYTCINCIRTLPHVTQWYDTYKDKGFVVIGVHTPEFAFEKDTNNVANAIKQFNIYYPVAQDNDYATWNAFNNEYWPAEYLIDTNGNIRHTHFGEDSYDETETDIKQLLQEAGQKVSQSLSTMPDETPQTQISPETYLGSARMQYYYPDGNTGNGTQNFTLDNSLSVDSFSLGGSWTITNENATAGKNAVLQYRFNANKVFLVITPKNQGDTMKVFLDGKMIPQSVAGDDVKNGIVTTDTPRLYNLVNLHGNNGEHLLRLEFQTQGTQLFAFTFG